MVRSKWWICKRANGCAGFPDSKNRKESLTLRRSTNFSWPAAMTEWFAFFAANRSRCSIRFISTLGQIAWRTIRHKTFLYVGYGGKDAGKDYGEVATIDGVRDAKIADIQVAAHPAELLLNQSGSTLFALIPAASEIQVISTKKRQVISTWPVSSQRPGDAAFDEPAKRLFLGTHVPPEMVAIDSTTGAEIANLPTMDGMDGVYFDARRRRIYISGGRGFDVGFVYVYQQQDPDHYSQIGRIPTRPGAGTSFWSPELDRYYVAAPANGTDVAAILAYEPSP